MSGEKHRWEKKVELILFEKDFLRVLVTKQLG